MAGYLVTAAMVRIPAEQQILLLARGSALPADIDPELVDRLLAKGLVVEVEDAGVEDATEVGSAPASVASADFDAMNLDQLREYAQANQVDLGGATKKADILAVLKA